MVKFKSIFFGSKTKIYAMVLVQGFIGLMVGNFFIRPALVTTAVVSTTIATSSLSAGPTCANGCVVVPKNGTKCSDTSGGTNKTDNLCIAACAAIAVTVTQNQTKTTTTAPTTTTAAACTTCKMFVTTSTYTGATIGGITGADAKCASDASKPATGTYKAFLVDDTNRIACTTANCSGGASENKNWVMKASTPYTRVDGTAIGTTTAAGIFPAFITNPISTTGDVLFGNIRTGMAFAKDWTSRVNGHCTNYTVSTGTSTDGDASSGTTNYLYVNGGACSGAKSLLCVEQ
jgi:hypothetical protein